MKKSRSKKREYIIFSLGDQRIFIGKSTKGDILRKDYALFSTKKLLEAIKKSPMTLRVKMNSLTEEQRSQVLETLELDVVKRKILEMR